MPEPHRALHAISIFWRPTASPARKLPLTSNVKTVVLSFAAFSSVFSEEYEECLQHSFLDFFYSG